MEFLELQGVKKEELEGIRENGVTEDGRSVILSLLGKSC